MQINNSKNRKNKGFTLIELIVVVSIILILSGFLVPKVIGYQNKAKEAKAINTARQIYDTSMQLYTEEQGVLTKGKLIDSILSVTGLQIDDDDVTLATDGVQTIKFTSDTKLYNMVVTPADNSYTVKDTAGTTVYPK